MHRDRRDPLCTRLVLGNDALLLKIVLEHLHVSRSEEMRFRWMETNRLNDSFGLSKWPCRIRPWQRVDENLRRCLNIMSHSRKVVSFRMPNHLTYNLAEVHLDHLVSFTVICLKSPFDILFLFVTCLGVTLILLLKLDKLVHCFLILFLGVKSCLNYENKLFVDNS